jgi:RNA recognition motif-containing protein
MSNADRPPLEPAPPSCNVYLNNLSSADSEQAVRAALSAFGEVTSLVVRTGKLGAFAFATFVEQSSADAAVASAPLSVDGDSCGVEFRRTQPRDPTQGRKKRKKRTRKVASLSQQVYLKGLGGDISEDDIRSALSGHGEIKKVFRRKLKGDESGQLCDYAFVTFTSDEEAAACVAAGASVSIAGSDVTVEARRARPRGDDGSADA